MLPPRLQGNLLHGQGEVQGDQVLQVKKTWYLEKIPRGGGVVIQSEKKVVLPYFSSEKQSCEQTRFTRVTIWQGGRSISLVDIF